MNTLKIRSLQSAALLAACLGFLTVGCGHPTVNVTATKSAPTLTEPPKKLDGIPFYVKRGMCKRETVWAEPRYTLQVNVMAGDKPAASRALVVSRSYLIANTGTKATDRRFAKLLEDLNALAAARKESDLESGPKSPICPETVADEWEKAVQTARDNENNLYCESVEKSGSATDNAGKTECVALATAVGNGDLLRLVNTANVVTEVDYEHVYYMNTRTPWIGNASADTTLNTDGTLSKGTIAVNDQTWSTIIGTIGALAGDVSSFESAKVTAGATVAVANAAQPTPTTTPTLPLNFGDSRPPTPTTPACKGAPGWPLPREATIKAVKEPIIAADVAPNVESKPVPKVKPNPKQKPDDKPTPDQAPDSTTTEDAVSYQVSIQATVYLHDHVKEDDGLGTACAASATGVTDGSVTIAKLDETKAKDDSGAIKVSGTVTLPKAAAPTPK